MVSRNFNPDREFDVLQLLLAGYQLHVDGALVPLELSKIMLHFVVLNPLLCEMFVNLPVQSIYPMLYFRCDNPRLLPLLLKLLFHVSSVLRDVMDMVVGVLKQKSAQLL